MPDTGLTDAFAPPWVEEIHRGDETLIFTLPYTDMDDWAACAQVLKANRRKENEAKLALNTRLTPYERESLLMEQDEKHPITFRYAFYYRTEIPVGIKSALKKAITKHGGIMRRNGTAVDERIEVKTDADADAWVKKIPPIRQWELAKIIADPPVLVKDDKAKGDDPNASPAANPTGESSPPSSENTGPASDPEA
jgi:hypothetical protein